KRILKDEKIYQNDKRLRDLIDNIQFGHIPKSLYTPINKDSESTLVDSLECKESNNFVDLYTIKTVVSKYLNYVVIGGSHPGMNKENLNAIARELVILVFSGKFDLSDRDDLKNIEWELKKRCKEKYPNNRKSSNR
uniref:hypothetical protein n=1 Tax=uncultured Treponema sp. TaxID=162155 RepID=UPI0025F2E3EB